MTRIIDPKHTNINNYREKTKSITRDTSFGGLIRTSEDIEVTDSFLNE